MDEFKPEAANDNYDKSIKTFDTFENVAEAFVEHLCDNFGENSPLTDEESVRSVVQRTSSISALVTVIQRLQGVSFPRMVEAYMDDLLKPKPLFKGDEESPYFFSPNSTQCIQGVLTDTLWNVLMGTNPGTFPEEYAAHWRTPTKNYLDPRYMKEDIRKFRDIILQYARLFDDVPEKICMQATERIALLRKAQE